MLWCRLHPVLRVPELALSISSERKWVPVTPPAEIRRGARCTGKCMVLLTSGSTNSPLRSASDGGVFWISEADLRPSGGIPGIVAASVAPWGVAIPERVASSWRAALRSVGPCRVHVAYHGTSQLLAPSLSQFGVWESRDGMLGRGVYLTHFWRAAMRYALMDVGYKVRPEGGAVARVYVHSLDFETRDGSPGVEMCCCGKCTCDKYVNLVRHRRVADHLALWRSGAVAGVHVPPCRGDTVDPKTGLLRWLARSDEWCCRGEMCSVQEIMRVDASSVKNVAEYDASDRGVKVF